MFNIEIAQRSRPSNKTQYMKNTRILLLTVTAQN